MLSICQADVDGLSEIKVEQINVNQLITDQLMAAAIWEILFMRLP